MYYVKELCIKLVTYQKLHRDARSAEYKIISDRLTFNVETCDKSVIKHLLISPDLSQ